MVFHFRGANLRTNAHGHPQEKPVMNRVLSLGLMVLLVMSLSGCLVLTAGTAGVVGYQLGKNDQPVGDQVDDASITTAVKASLLTAPGVDSLRVHVTTVDGVVTLDGSLSSEEMIERAVKATRETSGVRSVDSKLTLIPGD
jgi:hyperosmotically inducible protein